VPGYLRLLPLELDPERLVPLPELLERLDPLLEVPLLELELPEPL